MFAFWVEDDIHGTDGKRGVHAGKEGRYLPGYLRGVACTVAAAAKAVSAAAESARVLYSVGSRPGTVHDPTWPCRHSALLLPGARSAPHRLRQG